MTKVLWVTAGLDSGPLPAGASHDSASIRYRLLLPARAIACMGISSDVVNPEDAREANGIDLAVYKAMVIGKYSHFDPTMAQAFGANIVALAKRAKARGVRTIADVCDDRFEHPVLGAFLRELVGLVDHVVAGSDEMASIVRQRTQSRVTTIADPVEGARAEPRFVPPARRLRWLGRLRGADAQPLKLLWYGHQSNLDEVREFLPRLAAWATSQKMIDGIALAVVSAPGFGAEELAARYSAACSDFLQVCFLPWSSAAQEQALRDCDLVIIPATLGRAEKRVKSANRLCEALWAGRHVLAHPVPSYLEFHGCAWIGEDLLAGLAEVLHHRDQVPRQVQAGQDIISQRYSPQAVGQLWADAARGT